MAPIKNDTLTFASFDSVLEEEKPFSVENIRTEHPNAYKPWEKQEELELIDLYNSGEGIKEIAELLGRQKGGIRARLKKLGLISDDIKSVKSNVSVEIKYPVKSEHLIEPNLWEEEEVARHH